MQPLSTIEGIQAAIKQDPKLRFDTNLMAAYSKAGGTLSNNAIPIANASESPVINAKDPNGNPAYVGNPDINKTTVNTAFTFTNPLGITSSAQVPQGNQASAATTAAANAASGTPTSSSTTSTPSGDLPTTLKNYIDSAMQTNKDVADRLTKAADLSYNAALSKTSALYDAKRTELNNQYKNDIQVATSNAISLNPYSQSKGAQTSDNFTQAITSKYQAQSVALEAQASTAQAELEAGRYENYAKIVNEMDQSSADFAKTMFTFQNDWAKQAEQTRQFELTLGTNQKNISYDNALSSFKAANYSPDDINKMIDSGSIYQDPTFKQFFAASGNDPSSIPGIVNFMRTGSLAAANFALNTEKAANAANNANIRTAMAQEKYYNSLAGQIPSEGQVVTTNRETPVKLTDTQSQYLSMGLHINNAAEEVFNLIKELPTNAIKGWTVEAGKFVPIMQNVSDPKQADLLQKMNDISNTYIYFSTGKQLNEQEMNRLANQLPNIKASNSFNESALGDLTSSLKDRVNNYLQVNGWKFYGYDQGQLPTNTSAGTTSSTSPTNPFNPFNLP